MLVSAHAHAFALKYRVVLLTRFISSSHAATGSLSKPVVTRKKYSELPALPSFSSQDVISAPNCALVIFYPNSGLLT